MSRPEWLVPGAAVATMRKRGHSLRTITDITETTIERVLKRDVVLANGERFNVERLSRSHGAWENATYLVSIDDPRLVMAKRVNSELHAADGILRHLDIIEKEVRGWRDTGEDERFEEVNRRLGHLVRGLIKYKGERDG